MRAEGERGLAIQNTGEAVASRAIRGRMYFLFPLPRVGRPGGRGDTRLGAITHILLRRDRRRRAWKSTPVDLLFYLLRGIAVSSTSRMERGDDTQNVLTEKKNVRKKKRKKENAVRTIVVFFETRRETLPSSERRHGDPSKPRWEHIPLRTRWLTRKQEGAWSGMPFPACVISLKSRVPNLESRRLSGE